MITPLKKQMFLASAGLSVLAFILFHQPILNAIGDFIIVQNKIAPADEIHVIAGLDHRLDYAVELYRRGMGKHLFLQEDGAKIRIIMTSTI